jgi:hypothetical protein
MHGERLRVIGTADHARKWARVEAGLETARLGEISRFDGWGGELEALEAKKD